MSSWEPPFKSWWDCTQALTWPRYLNFDFCNGLWHVSFPLREHSKPRKENVAKKSSSRILKCHQMRILLMQPSSSFRYWREEGRVKGPAPFSETLFVPLHWLFLQINYLRAYFSPRLPSPLPPGPFKVQRSWGKEMAMEDEEEVSTEISW